jgi:hypothetical protein
VDPITLLWRSVGGVLAGSRSQDKSCHRKIESIHHRSNALISVSTFLSGFLYPEVGKGLRVTSATGLAM